MSMGSDQPSGAFCDLPAMDMYMDGFTYLPSGGNSCLTFLFQTAVVDTPVKYGFAIVGAFLLGLSSEGLRCARTWALRQKPPPTTSNWGTLIMYLLMAATLFLSHTVLVYWLMLLVMTYEWLIFGAVVLGLGTGFLINEARVLAAQRRAAASGKKVPVQREPRNFLCCEVGEIEPDETNSKR